MKNSAQKESALLNEFMKEYEPLLDKFLDEIKDVKMDNLPQPFFPTWNEGYEECKYKIAFVGWETRDNESLSDFYQTAKTDKIGALQSYNEVIEGKDFAFTGYGNNFGTGFWDFNMKFLGRFYNLDWKKIKEKKYPEILDTILWGNLNSLERYEVTAKEKGGSYEEWQKVKNASTILDNAGPLIKVFKPNILIVLRWMDNDSWLTGSYNTTHEIIIENKLEYYYVHETGTHVFWTCHPGYLSRISCDFDEIILNILLKVNEKKVFDDFPGSRIIYAVNKLNHQVEQLSEEMNLSSFKMPLGGKYSGFYFSKPDWKKYRIGFEFDSAWGRSFFGGVKKNYKEYPNLDAEPVSRKFMMNEQITEHWPYWYWYEDNYRDWNEKLYEEIENGNFILKIKSDLNRMLNTMNEFEKEGIEL